MFVNQVYSFRTFDDKSLLNTNIYIFFISTKEVKTDTDTDFVVEEDLEDDEHTLDEQEHVEEDVDHNQEIAELEKEGTTSS